MSDLTGKRIPKQTLHGSLSASGSSNPLNGNVITRDSSNPLRGYVLTRGFDGKSAYQYAVDGGYEGTEEEFAEKLKELMDGEKGVSSWNDLTDKPSGEDALSLVIGMGFIAPIVDENGSIYIDETGMVYIL